MCMTFSIVSKYHGIVIRWLQIICQKSMQNYNISIVDMIQVKSRIYFVSTTINAKVLYCKMGLFTVQSLAQLFQRCLMKVLHIDLWKCYLSYVRETKGKLPSYKYVRWLWFYGFIAIICLISIAISIMAISREKGYLYSLYNGFKDHNSVWDLKSNYKMENSGPWFKSKKKWF